MNRLDQRARVGQRGLAQVLQNSQDGQFAIRPAGNTQQRIDQLTVSVHNGQISNITSPGVNEWDLETLAVYQSQGQSESQGQGQEQQQQQKRFGT